MEKILGFFKNKSVGYYIAAGLALLALFMGIFFFLTYKSPAFPGVEDTPTMGNKAEGLVVETIGIFLLAGAVVEIAVLVIPQYRFIQIAAVAMFGLAFMKDMLVIADFFAGIANNVMYNGGHVGLNFFYFIMIALILIVSIVVAFLGFYKKDEEAVADMKNVKGVVNLAKLGGAGAIALAAILVASLVSADMVRKVNAGKQSGQQSESSEPDDDPFVEYNPITDEIKSIADAYDYDFDPDSVFIEQEESYDFSAVSSLPTNKSRTDVNLVYVFEGAYAEGYQGDYSQTYAYMYLWDDGKFGGTVGGTDVRGYWYNSSFDAPADDPATEDVDESKDCLNLVSNVSKYEFINFEKASGFYDWRTHIYLGFSWGTRSMEIAGYKYYPEVAMVIDQQDSMPEFKVGKDGDISAWTPTRILKNLSFSSVFVQTDVTWEATNGSVTVSYVDGQKARGISSIIAKFNAAGEQTITAKWNGFEASVTVTVTE